MQIGAEHLKIYSSKGHGKVGIAGVQFPKQVRNVPLRNRTA
jgi:hypothetical protein